MAERTWYWVAVVVMALGIHHSLVSGRFELPQGLADRTAALTQQVSAQAIRYLASAQAQLQAPGIRVVRVSPALPRVQARLASIQASVVRQQADVALRQADMIRARRDVLRSIATQEVQHSLDRCRRNVLRDSAANHRPADEGTI